MTWNEKLQAATNSRCVWWRHTECVPRPHEGRPTAVRGFRTLRGVTPCSLGSTSEVSKTLLSLDTLLVSNPAKQCHLNDTSTGCCCVYIVNRREVCVWGGGAKPVRVGAKKFFKIFLFLCVRVTGNVEEFLS